MGGAIDLLVSIIMNTKRWLSQRRKRSINDEFLRKIKPLIVFYRLFGICPVSNDNEYKICSFTWFWSLGHVVFQGGMVLVDQESSWKKFLLPYNMTRAFVVNGLILIEGRKFTKIIEKFCIFDALYGRIYYKPVKSGWLQSCWTWVIVSAICFISNYNISLFFSGFTMISSFIDTLIYTTRLNSAYLYIFLCWNIVSRIQDLSGQWNHQINMILKPKIMFLVTVPNENSLEKTRLVFFQLCEIVDYINKAFGSIILSLILTICSEMLVDLYLFFFLSGGQRITQLFYPIFNILTIYMLCSVSGEIHSQVR